MQQLPELIDGPHPEDADGSGGPAHALGHLGERQTFQIPQDKNLAVVGGESSQLIGHASGAFRALRMAAGRTRAADQRGLDSSGGALHVRHMLLQRDFTSRAAFLCHHLPLYDAGQVKDQDLAQPGHPLARAAAAEVVEVAARIQEHLYGQLAAPVLRVASRDVTVPFAKVLEQEYLYKPSEIEAAIRRTLEAKAPR